MPVVVDLSVYAIAIVCLALAWLLSKIIIALLSWVAKALNTISLGLIGDGWIGDVSQAVANALGDAFGWVNAQLGASLHAAARFFEWLWHEIVAANHLIVQLAEGQVTFSHAVAALRGILHEVKAGSHVAQSRVKTLEHEYHGIDQRVGRVEHELYQGIGHDLRIGLKQTEEKVAHLQDGVIPSIEQAEQDAASAISNLYDWVKGKASIIGVGTISVAVAAALDTLGLGNLRCPGFLNNLNRRGCGLWNGLEDLLGLFVDLFVIADLCEVIPLLETAYEDVAAPAVHLLTEAIDAMPCAAGHQPPPLTVPRLHLPANSSLALSLP